MRRARDRARRMPPRGQQQGRPRSTTTVPAHIRQEDGLGHADHNAPARGLGLGKAGRDRNAVEIGRLEGLVWKLAWANPGTRLVAGLPTHWPLSRDWATTMPAASRMTAVQPWDKCSSTNMASKRAARDGHAQIVAHDAVLENGHIQADQRAAGDRPAKTLPITGLAVSKTWRTFLPAARPGATACLRGGRS